MNLTKNFPIQVTTNRNLIQSEEELLSFINKYNTKLTLYYSIYQPQIKSFMNNCCNIEQNKYHFCNTKIDKICFDIDNLNSLQIIKKFHLYCLNNNLKHLILFSGQKGFHIYIFTKNYNYLKNPKNTLLNSHFFLIKEINLKVNGNGNSDVDSHIIGDVSRLMRLPNTLHLSSNLYCVPLTTQDLILGKSHILKKAEKQCFDFTFYGKELFDISKFDNGVIEYKREIPKLDIKIDINVSEILKNFPPCLKIMLSQDYIYWRQRFHILKYLIDRGYSEFEIELILKEFLTGKKHPIRGTDNYNDDIMKVQYKYIKSNLSLFSCNKIKDELLCPISFGLCDLIKEKPIYL